MYQFVSPCSAGSSGQRSHPQYGQVFGGLGAEDLSSKSLAGRVPEA